MPVKKVILLIFTVILCLCLCACNVDEKYATLLKHIDSGNYEGIKSEMMILSPDFKVEQEQLLEKAVWYEKYQTLITLLEQEDYDGAMADLENRIPKPPRPASTEVAITNDNWSEYFEILEYPVTDPFGRLYMYCSAFVPKAEYIDRIDYDTEFSMDISHIDNFIGVYTYSFFAGNRGIRVFE